MIFAKIMGDNKTRLKYKNKLMQKYRLVILNSESFEEKASLNFSRVRFYLFFVFLVLFFVFFSFLTIIYTPISNYIPGKSSSEIQKSLINLSLKSDSLENILKNRSIYFETIENIILGKELKSRIDTLQVSDSKKQISLDFNISKEDSLLRLAVERDNKGSFAENNTTQNEYLTFFSPISGIISDKYNSKSKHFGVDLVAKEKTRISSVLDGTVIVSTWTAETGYIIVIQHQKNFISIYKHNSVLLKSAGDFIKAGDHIAVIGNSGELSTGPHLHFELWHNGEPVNPENYISF